jgi:hypothetical protein
VASNPFAVPVWACWRIVTGACFRGSSGVGGEAEQWSRGSEVPFYSLFHLRDRVARWFSQSVSTDSEVFHSLQALGTGNLQPLRDVINAKRRVVDHEQTHHLSRRALKTFALRQTAQPLDEFMPVGFSGLHVCSGGAGSIPRNQEGINMHQCNLKLAAPACAALLSLYGCDGEAPPPPGLAAAATTSPSSWIDAVALGTPDDPIRNVGAGRPRFTRGETIILQVDVRSTPVNAAVATEWLKSDGEKVGEETRRARMGQDVLSFTAPTSGAMDPGEYRVRVSANNRAVREESFEVVSDAGGSP